MMTASAIITLFIYLCSLEEVRPTQPSLQNGPWTGTPPGRHRDATESFSHLSIYRCCYETALEQRSRPENWTIRLEIASQIFLVCINMSRLQDFATTTRLCHDYKTWPRLQDFATTTRLCHDYKTLPRLQDFATTTRLCYDY